MFESCACARVRVCACVCVCVCVLVPVAKGSRDEFTHIFCQLAFAASNAIARCVLSAYRSEVVSMMGVTEERRECSTTCVNDSERLAPCLPEMKDLFLSVPARVCFGRPDVPGFGVTYLWAKTGKGEMILRSRV